MWVEVRTEGRRGKERVSGGVACHVISWMRFSPDSGIVGAKHFENHVSTEQFRPPFREALLDGWAR